MPLEDATRRLAFLLQRDLRRLVERERVRSERGEEVRYDPVSRMATWESRRGEVIGRWYAEILATYVAAERTLRWATGPHAEAVVREGIQRGAPQLSRSEIDDLGDEEASTLARLGLLVARGEGIEHRRGAGVTDFIGLFDTPRPREVTADDGSRYSVPPPPVTTARTTGPGVVPRAPAAPVKSSPPPRTPYRSLPPIREIYLPRNVSRSEPEPAVSAPERLVREPTREIFRPAGMAALASLAKAAPGYEQALFVVTVDTEVAPGGADRRRLVVTLVVVDAAGRLRALDPSQTLVAEAVQMVEADRAAGNGAWRKLSARILPKADGGATLNIDVL